MTRLQMINAALRLKNISATEMLILIYFCNHASARRNARVAQASFANNLPLSIRAIKKNIRALEIAGYVKISRGFNKASGYQLVNVTSLIFANPSFVEPSKMQRKNAECALWPSASGAPHYIYRKLPSGSVANFVAQTDPKKTLANELKLIVGGKS